MIVAGKDELDAGKLSVKSMADKQQIDFTLSDDNLDLGAWLKEKLEI